jgi:hypothetical protein
VNVLDTLYSSGISRKLSAFLNRLQIKIHYSKDYKVQNPTCPFEPLINNFTTIAKIPQYQAFSHLKYIFALNLGGR